MKKGKQAGAVLLSCAMVAGCLSGCARGNGGGANAPSENAQSKAGEEIVSNAEAGCDCEKNGFEIPIVALVRRINDQIRMGDPYGKEDGYSLASILLPEDSYTARGYDFTMPDPKRSTRFLFADEDYDGRAEYINLFISTNPDDEKDCSVNDLFCFLEILVKSTDPSFRSPDNPVYTKWENYDLPKGEYIFNGIVYKMIWGYQDNAYYQLIAYPSDTTYVTTYEQYFLDDSFEKKDGVDTVGIAARKAAVEKWKEYIQPEDCTCKKSGFEAPVKTLVGRVNDRIRISSLHLEDSGFGPDGYKNTVQDKFESIKVVCTEQDQSGKAGFLGLYVVPKNTLSDIKIDIVNYTKAIIKAADPAYASDENPVYTQWNEYEGLTDGTYAYHGITYEVEHGGEGEQAYYRLLAYPTEKGYDKALLDYFK